MSKFYLSKEEFVSMPYLFCNSCNCTVINMDYDYSIEWNQNRFNFHLFYYPQMVKNICQCNRKRNRDIEENQDNINNKKHRIN